MIGEGALMMALKPSRNRHILTTGATRMMRYVLYAALVAGVGAMVHFRTSLALLANGPTGVRPMMSSARMPGGALVVVGGGKIPDSVRERFIELAGGPAARIVVIPTAHAYADGPTKDGAFEPWNTYPIESVKVLHTRSREMANDPEFVRPLTEATGVWFGGGRQEAPVLADAYLGTEVETQVSALLERGGVVGGTSAGAAIMSRLMITSTQRLPGGGTEALTATGFDLLPGVIFDQHFLKRKRLQRLQGVVQKHPELIGLGIDESTALVVDLRNKRVRVIGEALT